MKTILCFLAVLAVGLAFVVHDHQSHVFEADQTFLERQRQILRLYVRIQNPTVYQEVRDIASNYNIEEHVANYKNTQDVKRFIYLYRNDLLLPRGEMSSMFYYKHIEEAKLLFDVFYYAKDYDTFYKTAAWARDRVNPGIYFYALTNAVYARPDTKYIQLPPPYEVYPYMFVEQQVIQQAIDYYHSGVKPTDNRPYILNASSCGNESYIRNYERDPEQVLSYFTEDVGLNAFNEYFFLQYPSWYNATKYGVQVDRRGELFLNFIHQILSRYFFERLSNNLGDVEYINREDYLPQYYPGLRYANGKEIPTRPEHVRLQDTDKVTVHFLEELYERIRYAIDFGFYYTRDGTKMPLYTENGINVLGDILYSIGENPNYQGYGSFFNYLMYVAGKVVDPENSLGLAPGALLQYATQMRDPVYYQILHTIYDEFVYKYLKHMPQVTYEDLMFPGVTVTDFQVPKFSTYYDDFYVSLNQVVGVQNVDDIQKVDIRVRQQRLNHKPYEYRVTVNSDKEVDALVSVFLVPIYDSYGRTYDFEERVHYNVVLDRFPYKLTSGENVIVRSSQQSTVAVNDPDSFRMLYKKVEDAINGKQALKVDKYARPYGYPQRLLLPRGNRAGLPVRVVVRVDPYVPAENRDLSDAYEIDSVMYLGTPYGDKYPSANPINLWFNGVTRSLYDAQVPNAKAYDTMIYHVSQDEFVPEQTDSV